MDVVYTWVDDSFEGYRDLFDRYARTKHDRNPNRTRDNLSLLKYSLRSLERFAPWVRRVHLVTMRPQVPEWLNTERVRVVHHDEIFEPRHLPTFNSFAIVSRLARLTDVTERFLYVEDDRLMLSATTAEDFVTPDGKHVLYPCGGVTPHARLRDDESISPWNRALAEANRLLDERYGFSRRESLNRAPLVIDKASFEQFEGVFGDALERTRASRFRETGNVPCEHLYPYYLHYEGKASLLSKRDARQRTGYVGLERFAALSAPGLAWLGIRRPKLYCLNDNFGPSPTLGAVRAATRFLERHYPAPSSFERV